ncbi:hypothetical protein Tco_0752892 [Tanacetum coccineum]
MTMSRMQLNSKFVNNMLPEWSRFIIEVKLNRGLKESNFDQLYAYLKQHEVHANENRMMMERFIQPTNDPLALVSNASIQQYPTQSSMSQSTNQPSPMTSVHISSGLVLHHDDVCSHQFRPRLAPSHVPGTTNIPPTDKDLEILFQPMFDEYFEQSTDNAPSTSHSLSSLQVYPPVFPQGVATGPTIEDTLITQAGLHPSINPVAGEPDSTQSTSGDVSLDEPNQVNQPPAHLRKWTKDHPLDNIVVDCWFQAMQDEIHEFDRLEVWELVPRPSALYNGTEIVMTNHKPAVVHDSEETLEIAELTRKRMYGKMKSPQCVQNKVKFAPPDYSKENYLQFYATSERLTPELDILGQR